MRKVFKIYDPAPGELGPLTIHNNRLIRIYNGYGTINTDKIYPSIYGVAAVRKKLSDLYFDKCAYCETKDPEFEIEHYRPKAGVEDTTHHGYFWLAYEWSNLLPACHDCNKKRSKSTKFPIGGTRVDNPVIINNEYKFSDHYFLSRRLKREYPLLIHPEEPDFDPNTYFKFDELGKMLPAAKKNSFKYKRAYETIEEIVRLNREKLYIHERRLEIERYKKRWLVNFLFYLENFIKYGQNVADDILEKEFFGTLDEIKSRGKIDKEFSFFWTYVYKNVYSYLPKELKKRPKDRTRFIILTRKHLNLN